MSKLNELDESTSPTKKYFKSKKSFNIKNGKNNIIYPIFYECIKFTDDDFWKNIFEELSYGKCPKSIYISGNNIYSTNKRKNFSYVIDNNNKNPEDVFNDIRDLLMNNTSICSTKDISKKKEQIKENAVVDNYSSWSEIKKKNIREIYIIKFVIRMKRKYDISWPAARQLYSIIQIAFLYKTQCSKDVIFTNGRIESINGIEYISETKTFINTYIDNDSPKDKNEVQDDGSKYLYYYWDRYVSSLLRVN